MRLENIPEGEAAQIKHIAELTLKQLERRYAEAPRFLRGVHAKDHGCVKATFTVRRDLPHYLRVGVFATPGKTFDAWIRFSNADVLVKPDTAPGTDAKPATDTTPEIPSKPPIHGSRGMAIKLLNVSGEPLLPDVKPLTQDFLMINQPMFAFANVADYEVLSQVLEKKDDPSPFFQKQLTSSDPLVQQRAKVTLGIVTEIQRTLVASPVETRYFSAAPFGFGASQVMKYSANPTMPFTAGAPDFNDPNYLRTALTKRLASGLPDVTFDFQVQLQDACEIEGDVDVQIENACTKWPGENFPFETVATIRISPQDFNTAERRAECEALVFNPWHGVTEHRPLGGINRLRRDVYLTSSERRLRKS